MHVTGEPPCRLCFTRVLHNTLLLIALLTHRDYFHIVFVLLIWAFFFLFTVQGLANESSNHSYGSLGSSSDKESEVKNKKNKINKLLFVVRKVKADEMKHI